MKRLVITFAVTILASLALGGGDEAGHMHGPDGRHIVAEQDAGGNGSFILSHHDLRIEAEGKSVVGATVQSTIYLKGKPDDPIHSEKNAYEPENEVYGSHMTYTAAGEYVLNQNVALPNGRKLTVEFPVFVVSVAPAQGEPAHDHHGPDFLLIGGGIVAGITALIVAYRMGRKSVGNGLSILLVAALIASLFPSNAYAGGDEEGHMHGPDGRHIVTNADAANAAGPKFKAFPGPNQQDSAKKVVDGITFVLTIENEEVTPDPDLVTVSKTQIDLIDLKLATVEVTGDATGLQTTGKVSANPNGLVKVNARAAGRITQLGALPGTNVRKGQVLAIIESAELADAQAAFRQATAELAQSMAGIQVAEAGLASARTEVRVASAKLDRVESLARAGEFESPALEKARSERSAARSRLDAAAAEAQRLEKLVARLREGLQSGVVAQRDLERAEAELVEASAEKADATTQSRLAENALSREESIAKQGLRNAREVDQARAQLEIAQSDQKSAESRLMQARADVNRARSSIRVASDRIRLLGGTPGGGNTITVTSPIAAEVEHRFVSVGQTVSAGDLLYDLLNADIVWVLADVYESDVPRVKVGQTMRVVADAYPEEVYEGEVAFIHNEVDPQTRTTQVRVVINNPGERLKQNMFVRVMLGVGSSNAVTVPSSAVQDDKGIPVVFVEERPSVYRRTMVQVKGSFGERTIVGGIEPGRKVVSNGSYQLLSLGGSK